MKKTILSLVTISAIATTGALADSATDIAELKAMMTQMNKRLAKLEAENKQLKSEVKKKSTKKKTSMAKATPSEKQERTDAVVEKFEKSTPVFAKASKLKFSGRHYLGFVHGKNEDHLTGESNSYNDFESRRNYIQVKAYLFDDPKSYMRVTLDTHQVGNGKDVNNGDIVKGGNTGDWEVRLKYAYLYINDILPYTGVEFGQAHRPWIDYEEHHGWLYRSISKTFVEKKQDADFTNSADLGVNFKTKTEYFSSEIGLFNGEGYHGLLDKDDTSGLSFEWRLTANLLGTGEKHVHKHDQYADISFYGQYNTDLTKKGEFNPDTGEFDGDFVWYGFNAVYNQPEFLIAGNYLKSTKASPAFKGDGFSVNGELRMLTFDESLDDWNIIGRYDKWDLDSGEERETWIAGLAYTWNKNIEFILNYEDDTDTRTVAIDNETQRVLFTADVKW
ncbi:hypothetical protein [Sulfurovum sp. NBC37-1]|uniref:hypothetical protein n=1 Tax=Sulfurovum sp. (strain NBC37-1) TaxID=387093 RepID=UPI000158792D|nr:hypothetical protein [Sulfurovum sp. NBC37-1]BAF73216.1 conserved hypothetical protein [Sulfurovum sp. NBC37-1]